MPDSLAHVRTLIASHPTLSGARASVERAAEALIACFRTGNKLLVCGNGGSCADADHIVGELVKGFLKKRPLPEETRARIRAAVPEGGEKLASSLQGGLPAINLAAHASLFTAFANDVNADYAYAQQVGAYGRRGDVLLGISTSGNAQNVACAVGVARALGLVTIGLTGLTGGRLRAMCDQCICVPAVETYKVQELHLPVYHALCAEVEEALFG